ncbi:PREDICTED: esterase E4-like [Nicrophorus vespilloides]|uniref:Carboxylic ester hydrolase n=1 Tax=Nicrophorus vespilloides TaxID=110193 RepID=A0ABM1MFT8_NICVS|nr:PREDICTED: esterase E4-like [Nicrophorus vespilloides]
MIILCLILGFMTLCDGQENIVETEGGKLRGATLKNYKGEDFLAFMSIPYAEPPLGPLRFKALQPVKPWEGVRDATVDLPKCIHTHLGVQTGVEDCVYMNVYTKDPNPSELKHVMVYLHEGGFYFGSSSVDVIGPHHIMIEDVVLVTFDYRLGALGFLHLEGSDIVENNGVKDQVFALKWVQRNIHKFGGNKDSVTIFGESAGGVAVNLHMVSPMSKGLFHRGISHSGVALVPWMLGNRNTGLELAAKLGIESNDPKIIEDELRKKPYTDIFQAQQEMFWLARPQSLWNGGLVVEGPGEDHFLTAGPYDMLKDPWSVGMPYIIGYNNLEAVFVEILETMFGFPHDYTLQNDMSHALIEGDPNILNEVIEEVKKFYFGGNLPVKYDYDLLQLMTDISFRYPVIQLVRKWASTYPMYLYEFTADTKLNLFKNAIPQTAKYQGAAHMDELCYIFRHSFNADIELGSTEDKVVEKMVKMWTNFAKYGQPIPDGENADLDNVVWKKVNSNEMNCLVLNHKQLNDTILDVKFADFWDSLHKKYNRQY